MMPMQSPHGGPTAAARSVLMVAVPLALLLGMYGRFKGIGTWPLGVDEFYVSRSIDHVLATGLPRFPCGGYYTRGLLFQYTVAALRAVGLSPEFAGRFVAAVCSVAVLPAAYLLGSRLRGPLAGWLTVAILAVSIWEIEMARFGRMYAPFQAVFVWYSVFYLRYTTERDDAALRWMIGLSIAGVLTWEGGTLLGAANLFAVIQRHGRGRFEAAQWRRLGGLSVLLVLLYLATLDLRGFAPPAAEDAAASSGAPDRLQTLLAWLAPLREHPIWGVAFLVLLGFAAFSLRVGWSQRQRWMSFAGLCIVLLAAVLHALAAAAGVLALMLLLGLIDWRDLIARQKRPYLIALVALAAFWLAFALLAGREPFATGSAVPGAGLDSPTLEALLGFPDVFQRIARPWGRTAPLLSAVLALAVAYWFVKSIARPASPDAPVTVLLALLMLMVLAVGAIPTNRIETRYTFFLYPLLIGFAVSAGLEMTAAWRLRGYVPGLLLTTAPLLCFGATEDCQIRQILQIDSAATNFRVGMSPARADHYYPRNDIRGVAIWLSTHVQAGDLVIDGIPNLDQYYGRFDYYFLDQEDNRYDAYVCRDGRTERWTNHPVIYKVTALKSLIDSGHRVYAPLYSDVEARLRHDAQSQGWSVTRVYTAQDGHTDVVMVSRNP